MPALLPAVLAAVLVAGGCGDASAPGPRADREARATPTDTPGPAEHSATPSRPTPAATSRPTAEPDKGQDTGLGNGQGNGQGKIAPTPLPMARPDGSRTHLLSAGTLPVAGTDGWTVRSTAPEGTRRVGACQQASLVDIGALHAVIRVFDGPEGSGLRSRQLVARLADPKSAWRTHEVLRSWRADCEERLDHRALDVGPMEVVDVDAGRGGHYRATYGPAKDTHATGLGIVRSSRWVSVVEITAPEGDVPQTWARRAVRRIAATFGG